MSVKFNLACAAFALSILPGLANAQEIDADHLKKAKKALVATEATVAFDDILPAAASALKLRMVGANPNLADQIDLIVDEEAITLAARRGALENESAKLFAITFSPEELTEISNFFSTETGKKYLDSTPILARELSKAARVWRTGIERDLAEASVKKLEAAIK